MSPRAGRRSRATKPELVTIYWRDIPAQVTATHGEERVKVLLDARFQHAIDRAAMVAGKSDTQNYVAEWRRVAAPFAGDAQVAADTEAAQIDAAYDNTRVEALVHAGGVDETATETDPSTGADNTPNAGDIAPADGL